MTNRRKLWIAVGAAGTLAVAAALGAAGAIAASDAPSRNEESQAVIDDAAKRLGLAPSELSDALQQALQSRVDAAVEAGRLTEAQGADLKARIQSGRMPLVPGGLGHGPWHGGPFGHASRLDAAASYLELDESELHERLAEGKTLAEIAAAEGKSVDGLVDVLVEEANAELDRAVADGRLTEERADELADRLEARITDLVNGNVPERGLGRPFGDRPHHPGLGLGRHARHS